MATPEENTDCVVHLNTSDIVGLAFITESGVISTVAVLIFAGLVLRNVIETRRHPGPNGPVPLIRTHVDGYMLSLLFADLLQGLGAVTSARWAAEGKVTCGSYCVAQGAIQQIGETGVAMSTLVITFHTFATVFFRWQPSRYPWLWMVVVACIWTFLLLFVVVGYVVHKGAERRGGTPYFGPTPFWCWIGSHYMGERIAGEYFWLWFSAFASIVLYPFLFLMLRGNIDVDPNNWKRISFHSRSRDGVFMNLGSPAQRVQMDAEAVRQERVKNKEAMKMFWYPISYTILVLPLSINRWRSSFKPSSNAGVEKLSIVPTSVVLFIFGLSGLCNVLLFLLTRPNLLLFSVRRKLREDRNRQPSQATSTGVSFAIPRPSYGTASSPSAPGMHQTRGMRREYDNPEENSDEGFSEGLRRRSNSIEFPGEPNYPPLPAQMAPRPPPSVSPVGSPFSNGMERAADGPGEAVHMATFGAPRDSIPSSAGYENHQPGAEDSLMRRTSAGSSRYTTATTSVNGTIPTANKRRSGASATRFREHFHDDDVPISGIRTIPRDHRLPTQQSMTLPVMPEPSSTLRRQTSSQPEGEEVPLTTIPPPPDAIYSRSASRIPPSSPTNPVAPPAPPPTGYPSPDGARSRVEEWALSTGPPQPPRGPGQ